ncbi:MAG: hypothetical protein JOZ07_16690 [Solirubrobacterales bacterium]|nr:hypothetical protein [Solirubrobacterales bacterium]
MEELHGLCTRLLGSGEEARAAELQARESGESDRLESLRAAVLACRGRRPSPQLTLQEAGDLRRSVAREVAEAAEGLPEAEREALALRELMGLSHDEIATVLDVGSDEVAPLLARARLDLRAALRDAEGPPACEQRERSLRVISRRIDGEPVSEEDEDWLLVHLGGCSACARAHSAILEASACYRAWRPEEELAADAGPSADSAP